MAIRNMRRYAGTNVPRYTSYPTAPHFNGEIDEARYRTWLSDISAGSSTSIYLHVPYCKDICAYCGCFTKATHKVAPLERYAGLLAREIALVGDALGGRPRVDHMHWGGGTPSMLTADGFKAIFTALGQAFDMSAVEEHAIELDPRLVDTRLAEALKSYGVTRVSLGVQDLNEKVQQSIGRVQPLDVVQRALDALRAAGLPAVNMDLMYGLPHQSLEDLVRSVSACAAMGADRIALFGYAHVPWMKKNQTLIDESELPSARARLEQMRAAHKALAHHGYVPIGFDHFAKPDDPMTLAQQSGRLRRNFQGYTTDNAPALIGFGASAVGKLPQGYIQNAADIHRWEREVEAGSLPVARGYALTDDDRLRGSIIEELLTQFSVDLSKERDGVRPTQSWVNAQIIQLDDLEEDGLCEVVGPRVRVPEDARFLARLVAARFDRYLEIKQARHSVAV